jgi:hypothetical protein
VWRLIFVQNIFTADHQLMHLSPCFLQRLLRDWDQNKAYQSIEKYELQQLMFTRQCVSSIGSARANFSVISQEASRSFDNEGDLTIYLHV